MLLPIGASGVSWREEVAWIYERHKTTGTFPPRRSRPDASRADRFNGDNLMKKGWYVMNKFTSKCISRLVFTALAGVVLMLASAGGAVAGVIVDIKVTSDTDFGTEVGDTLKVTEPTIPIDKFENITDALAPMAVESKIKNLNFIAPDHILLSDVGDTKPGDELAYGNIGNDAFVYYASDNEAGILPTPPEEVVRIKSRTDTFPTSGTTTTFEVTAGASVVPEPASITLAAVGVLTIVLSRQVFRRWRTRKW
jgi:hypothetical protein